MDKMITITVDTNDADYMTEVSKISEEDLIIVRKIVAKIKAFEPYKVEYQRSTGYVVTRTCTNNWPSGDCRREDMGEKSPQEIYDLTDEEIDIFYEFTPSSEWGFHTVESISVAPTTEIETLV